jgi:hypothetical protein
MELPEPIWLEICKFLQAKDLCKLALVNSYFRIIASNNYTWENIIIQRHSKLPKGIENLKKNYAEINCMATRMISKYQSEAVYFEKVLDKERQRQKKALETKRLERLLKRSLIDLEKG